MCPLPQNDPVQETMSSVAQGFEDALSLIYLKVSVTALVSCVILDALIFVWIGWSAFSVLQAIGTCLVIIVVSIGVLGIRKKKALKDAIEALNAISCDMAQFKSFIMGDGLRYELAAAYLRRLEKPDGTSASSSEQDFHTP